MTRKALTEAASADADHEQVLAGLKSDDWKQRLEEARAKRQLVLKQRAEAAQTPPPAVVVPLSPPEHEAVSAADASTAAQPEATSRIILAAPPRPVARPVWPRRLGQAAAAVAVLALGLGGWALWPDRTPVAAPDPVRTGPVVTQDDVSPDQADIAHAEPKAGPVAALLDRLAKVVPSATRVHVPAEMDITAAGSTLRMVQSPFATDRAVVRYYHEADRDLALRSAKVIDADTQDFTGYAPKPKAGTIEIWLDG